MRTHTALATLLVLVTCVLQIPASAYPGASSRLQVLVIDQASMPVPNATVTVYTLDGLPGVTATTDADGKVVFPRLGAGMAQVVARVAGYTPSIEKTTLGTGDNVQTAKLYADRSSVTTSYAPVTARS
jgi:Carboxypeptidase regulatory-like domain